MTKNKASIISQTKIWVQLHQHYIATRHIHMRDLFNCDKNRFENMNVNLNGLLLDYSKNRITEDTLSLLIQLANTVNLQQWIEKLFIGVKINTSENKAVLHTALRAGVSEEIFVDNVNIVPQIYQELNKALEFSQLVRQGIHKGYSGKRIKNIVNIGIGGSDLGPKMLTEALKPFKTKDLKIFFVSNIDSSHIVNTLTDLNPEETLFIIASKSFTTKETLLNAQVAKNWFISKTKHEHLDKHFFAVSNNKEAVLKFPIAESNFFYVFEWVGGRFSSWSTIGLSLMLAIGRENFLNFLKGARQMDTHFFNTPFRKNLPVLLGLIGIWYNTFYKISNYAIIPYAHELRHFPAFIQQLDMESNGKKTSRDGQNLDFDTGAVIWGAEGVNCQHAFFQLLHQGTRLIPSDFIVIAKSYYKSEIGQHNNLVANAFAQTRALMMGKTEYEVYNELSHLVQKDKLILQHHFFYGNQPTNTILLDQLDPFNLGMLIALYEHKVFVQGIIWGINSFDQWGVEYGKKLSAEIGLQLTNNSQLYYDSSTNGLIAAFRKINDGD